MTEWNLGAASSATLSLYNPENITGVSQLSRLVSSCPRPFVLVNERELSVLRRGLTKDGWKRSLYLQPGTKNITSPYEGAALLSIANQWLDVEIAIPEAGGYQDRIFCDCGFKLEFSDGCGAKNSFICPNCGDKWSGESCDAAVKYVRHHQLSSAALCLALAYSIEKDRAFADKAAEIIVRYAEAYPNTDSDLANGGIFRDSESEAKWVIPLAQAYDLLYYSRSFNDEDKDFIQRKLFQSIAQRLQSSENLDATCCWQTSAIGVIGLSIKDAELLKFALDSFKLGIIDNLGEDGLWPGSVQGSHFSNLSAFVHLAEACYRVGVDIYNWQVIPGKSLKQMFLAPLHYMTPSLRLPAIGDGEYESLLPLNLYEIAHRRWDDPSFAWVLKKGYKFGESPVSSEQRKHQKSFMRNSFYAFMFGRDLPGRSGVPAIKSQDFVNAGVCSLRSSEDLVMTLDYGPCMPEGHLDKLSFTLFANNSIVVPDYGTPDAASKLFDWYKGTTAHNTVVVDGKSQTPATDYGLVARYSGTLSQFAEAVASDCYPGVTHNRKMLVFGDSCVVIDELASNQEHNYDWLMHCEGEPEVYESGKSNDFDLTNYPYLKTESAYGQVGMSRINWQGEDGDLHFALWNIAGDGKIAIGKCPAETPARQTSFFLSRQSGLSSKFISAFVPVSKDESVEMSMSGCVLTLTSPDHCHSVYIRGFGEESPKHPLTTDAEIAAVHMCGDEILAITLIKGSWIKWKGELLLESSSEVDCIEVSFEDRSPAIKYCGDAVGAVKLKTAARAMRVNGYRAAASSFNGHAVLRVTSQMLQNDLIASRD